MSDGDTSSANPVALEAFVNTAMQLDAQLEVGAVALRAAIAQFTSSCTEYPTGIDESLADQIQDLARRNTELSLWVRQVTSEFTQADTGHIDPPLTEPTDDYLNSFPDPGSQTGLGAAAARGLGPAAADDPLVTLHQRAVAGPPRDLAAQFWTEWEADSAAQTQTNQVPLDVQTMTVDQILAEGTPIVPEPGQPQGQGGGDRWYVDVQTSPGLPTRTDSTTDSPQWGSQGQPSPEVGGGFGGSPQAWPPIESSITPPLEGGTPIDGGVSGPFAPPTTWDGHQPPIETPPIDGGHQPPIETPPIDGGHQPPIEIPPIDGWPIPVPGFPIQIGGGIATSTLGVGGWTLTPSRDPATAPDPPEAPGGGIPVDGQPGSPPTIPPQDAPAPAPVDPAPPKPAPAPAPPPQDPTLPDRVIVDDKGVKITHNYRSGDHAPPHLHVEGQGPSTKIGQNGKPLDGSPELSAPQERVIQDHLADIRSAVSKIMRWYRSPGNSP